MGPNEGKNFLEQMHCAVRALMSRSPLQFKSGIVFVQRLEEYESKHGSARYKWFKSSSPWGDRYVYIGDGGEEPGKSDERLPEGAEVAETFVIKLSELEDGFERAISRLEVRLNEPNGLLDLLDTFDTTKLKSSESEALPNEILHPSQAYKEMVDLLNNVARALIQNLIKSLEACRLGFNEARITEFRNRLRQLPDTLYLRAHERDSLLVAPKHLVAFSKQLADERQGYCADALLFGSVAATVDICGHCAKTAQENSANADRDRTFAKVFNRLSWFLTSGKETDPTRILSGTVQEAISAGFVDVLIKISSNYTEKVASKMEEAKNSETIDRFLDILYGAVPYAHGAHIILARLSDNAEHLDDSIVRRVRGAYFRVDEMYAALGLPFLYQVLDFDGARWRQRKKLLVEIKRQKGAKAAEEAAIRLVERNLFCPRPLIPSLMSENDI